MPVLNPVVTKLTAASNSVVDYLAAMFTHFGTSTKFSIVANGGAADAFTITPAAAAETWQLNLRWGTAPTRAVSAIDPLANIIDPGAGGGAAPTLTSDLEWSLETQTMEIAAGGAESVDFYLIELDDALIVLFMDAAKTFNPRAMFYGRLFVPYYTDGAGVGNDYCDGLAMCGHLPRITTGSNANFWLSTAGANASRARGFRNYAAVPGDQWFRPSAQVIPGSTDQADIDGNKKIFPACPVMLESVGGPTVGYKCGYAKYCASENTSQLPGTVLDGGGPSGDGWVHVYDSNAAVSNGILLPWDRTMTPEF